MSTQALMIDDRTPWVPTREAVTGPLYAEGVRIGEAELHPDGRVTYRLDPDVTIDHIKAAIEGGKHHGVSIGCKVAPGDRGQARVFLAPSNGNPSIEVALIGLVTDDAIAIQVTEAFTDGGGAQLAAVAGSERSTAMESENTGSRRGGVRHIAKVKGNAHKPPVGRDAKRKEARKASRKARKAHRK